MTDQPPRPRGPLDRRILALSPALRAHVARSTALAGVVAAAVLVQAEAIARLLPRLVDGEAAAVGPLVGWLVLAGVLRSAVGAATEWSATRALLATRAAIRARVLDRVRDIRSDHRDDVGPARVAALTSTAADALEPWVRTYVPAFALAVIVPPAAGLRILGADVLSAVILAIVVPLVPTFMVLIGWATEAKAAGQWAALQRMADRFLEVLTGLPTLRLFGRAQAQVERVREVTDRYRRATLRTLRVAFLSAFALELLASLSVAIVAVSLGARLAGGSLELETALVVLLLAPECLLPLRRVGAAFHAATAGLDAAVEVGEVLALPTEPAGDAAPGTGALVADAVAVTGPGRGPRLRPTSCAVGAGEVVAVRGPSGSGKSTLLEVLRGALPADAGVVRVGATDVGDLDADLRRRTIRWVGQRPAPLGSDVVGTVLVGTDGSPSATAAATRWSAALDLGGLGDRDPSTLSGGEARRLALARALVAVELGGVRFLLVDEPTAQLDGRRSASVVEAIRWAAAQGVGVVVATHDDRFGALADREVDLTEAGSDVPVARSEDRRQTLLGAVRGADAPAIGGGERSAPVLARTAGQPPLTDAPPLDDGLAPGSASADRRWVWDLSRPQRRRFVVAYLLGIVTELCAVALIATAAWMIVRAGERPSFADLALAAVGVRAFALGKAVFRYAERLVSHDAALRVLAEARSVVVGRLARLAPTGLPARGRGELLARLVDDIDRLQDLFLRVVGPVAAGLVAAVAAVGLTTALDPAAGAALGAAVLLVGVAVPVAAHRAALARGARTATAKGAVVAEVVRLVEGGADLVAVGGEPAARADVEAGAARVDDLDRRQGRVAASITAVVAGAPAFATAAVVAAAGPAGSGLAGPALGLIVLLPVAVVEVLAPLSAAGESLARVDASARRVRSLLDRPDPVREPEHPAAAPERSSAAVVLDDVSVGWPDGPTVLAGVDLDVAPGARAVVVGPSGSGKSTMAALLVGFLQARTGRMSIGAVPAFGDGAVDGLDGSTIRTLVTWCPQDPWFASSSLADNLRIAAPDATDADLVRALGVVQLGPWFEALPDGLATRLGRDASSLSGGERVRLSVARAVLGGQVTVVLDEPTAHLDAPTAAALLHDVDHALSGRGLVLIGHDPALEPLGPVLRVEPDTAGAARVVRLSPGGGSGGCTGCRGPARG